jgi:threonine dehydratase
LAAALAGKIALDEHTVIMLTGGNTDAQSFAETVTGSD